MLTTSNEEINKYKELYSQLVNEFAELHNAHLVFLKFQGREPGYATRKRLRAIIDLASELRRQGVKVCKESVRNNRIEQLRRRAELKNKPKKKLGRPKKEI
jgi:hypothetical protein